MIRRMLSAVSSASLVMLMPLAAFAQTSSGTGGNTIGGTLTNLTGDLFSTSNGTNLGINNLATWAFYVGGVLMVASALYKLASHGDGREENAGRVGLARLIAGVLLCALPGVAGILAASLGMPTGADISVTNVAVPTGNLSALAVIANLVNDSLGPALVLLRAVCWFMGLCLIGHSLLKFARISNGQAQETIGSTLVALLIGAVLMNVDGLYAITSASLGIQGSVGLAPTGTSYTVSSGTSSLDLSSIIQPLFYFLFFFGAVFFVRGLIVLKHAAERRGDATIGKGMTHIIGGVILCNGTWLANVAAATLKLPGN